MRLIINIDKGLASVYMNLQADKQQVNLNNAGFETAKERDYLEEYGSWEMPDPENIEHLKRKI